MNDSQIKILYVNDLLWPQLASAPIPAHCLL
jgi:hypothetical protein